jgi:hypothetical protein
MSTYLVAWVVGELSHNELQCELALQPTPAPSSSSSGRRRLQRNRLAPSSSSSSGRRRLRHEGEEHEHEHGHEHRGDEAVPHKHNVTVRVWGTTDRVQQFGHARDVACAALQEMEKLTKVRRPSDAMTCCSSCSCASGCSPAPPLRWSQGLQLLQPGKGSLQLSSLLRMSRYCLRHTCCTATATHTYAHLLHLPHLLHLLHTYPHPYLLQLLHYHRQRWLFAEAHCCACPSTHTASQVAFPLPKLDLVAIPNFAAGAMENWGLLTYRERALLVDDTRDDMHQRYAIATTVAHETVRRRAMRPACGCSTVNAHARTLCCCERAGLG